MEYAGITQQHGGSTTRYGRLFTFMTLGCILIKLSAIVPDNKWRTDGLLRSLSELYIFPFSPRYYFC